MIWIIQHQDKVPAGQYGTLLQQLDRGYRIVELHKGDALPTLQPGDAVLALGGTMGFDDGDRYPWLPPLKAFLGEAAGADMPLFCICLGAQLLADALGGTVTRNRNQERGISRIHLTEGGRRDPLLADIPTTFPAMQWHNDSFDLPPNAIHLATSSTCPVQAFRYRNAYAVQFHPEVNQQIVTDWNASLDPPGFYNQEFAFACPDWQPVWDRLLINFLDIGQAGPGH